MATLFTTTLHLADARIEGPYYQVGRHVPEHHRVELLDATPFDADLVARTEDKPPPDLVGLMEVPRGMVAVLLVVTHEDAQRLFGYRAEGRRP